MSEGDGMAEVTEADWLRAHAVLREWLSAVPAVDAQVRTTQAQKELERAIAQALAEEREKARAPFLALADEIDAWNGDTPDERAAYYSAAEAIRRAAEETP